MTILCPDCEGKYYIPLFFKDGRESDVILPCFRCSGQGVISYLGETERTEV